MCCVNVGWNFFEGLILAASISALIIPCQKRRIKVDLLHNIEILDFGVIFTPSSGATESSHNDISSRAHHNQFDF